MLGPIGAVVLLASASQPLQIDVGNANWSAFPPLRAKERPLPTRDMVDKVETILETGRCKIAGQSARRFNITIPYAVLVEPDGQARRAVIGGTGCAELETLVGAVVMAMAREGDFTPTREAKARWFASEINFSLQ